MGPRPLVENTLYYGDSLDILERYIPDESIDLIYLDPPFNSNRNYNVLFKEGKVDSTAQIHAFVDTWEWTPATIQLYYDLTHNNPNPTIAILIDSLAQFIGHNPMMAYLVNMTARLIPLHRVLKSTGSLFLHCDPTASHYLKIILDVIFGKEHFRNEIIWCYRKWSISQKQFVRNHDVILFYTKSEKNTFNTLYIPVSEGTMKRWKGQKQQAVFEDGVRKAASINEEAAHTPMPDWWQISIINPASKERLGYPTQKPEALLERIIQASSNEGDWILDPFCGCGTSVAVAQRLNRHWIGIDISIQAIKIIKQRLEQHYPGIHIPTDGIPKDYESACALSAKDKMQFQDWAISLVDGAYAPSGTTKRGADWGIDGFVLFYEPVDYHKAEQKRRKIVVQVKGGTRERRDIATLKGDMERENAPMGIFITLYDPTPQMKREAALAGEYHYSTSKVFPRVQILSVKDYFDGKTVQVPSSTVNPFKTAEVKADQHYLFPGLAG
jgi:DNA modification methylase